MTPDWLDSWCSTKRLSQQDLARIWATRGSVEPEQQLELILRAQRPAKSPPSPPLPVEHTKYILANGKQAYRKWMSAGMPRIDGHPVSQGGRD